jgi:penicillin-binding protein 2
MSPLITSNAPEQGRVRRIITLSVILLLVLAVRLFQIQVLASGGYLRLSRDNQFRELRINAPRGLILDRNGEVLAENQAACEVSLSVRTLNLNPPLIDQLAGILECPAEEIRERLTWGEERGKTRITIERNLTKEQILIIEEQLPQLPGVKLRDWARRTYPHASLGAHLLGYVGEARDEEIDQKSRDPRAYRMGDLIGRNGVERTYESLLRGTEGKELFLVNARGAQLETVEFLPPVAGNRLYLTIDLDLTAQLDSALAFWGAGAGVVLDVATGEILAAASRPAFDPNLLVGGISTRLWRQLTEDPAKPLFNRISQAMYSPGSIFKPMVALEALAAGVVEPETRLVGCTGGMQLGRRFFRCWEHSGHGRTNLVEAMAQSCDVYFYQVGGSLGIERLASVARLFGFGDVTGADLDSESRGLVPDTAWYDKHLGKGKWTEGNIWNVSIGQGEVLVNCLQMARAFAALANGGKLVTPRLRHHLEDENGQMLIPFTPGHGTKDLKLDKRDLAKVVEGMVEVLHGEKGTARGSKLPGMITAGKTGTVQNPHGTEHAWFCGFAPAEDPEIAIALIVEHGEHGSDIAPIFRQLVNVWFDLGVRPLRRGLRSEKEGQP